MKTAVLLSIILLFAAASCRYPLPPANRVTVVQPFADFPLLQAKNLYKELKKINPKIILRKAIPLPVSAYYEPNKRYRADVIINYLDHSGSADTVIIGLTTRDMSTTKGNIADWGIMGLGFTPGNACVVSTFRLAKAKLSRQFYKVAIHELGHTAGLPHCSDPSCLMCDARGANHLDREKGFCPSCRAFLKNKGWLLQ